MSLLVFGGAFDPPHIGHVHLLKAALKASGAAEAMVIPTAFPPHKKEVTPFDMRLEMARLAFGNIAEVSDFEKDSAPSYTYRTLEKLGEKGEELYLALGGDSMESFHSWKNPDRIARAAKIIAVKRGGQALSPVVEALSKEYSAQIICAKEDVPDISSRQMRLVLEFERALGDCKELTDISSSGFVPCDVRDFIERNGLYSRYTDLIIRLHASLKASRLRHTFSVALTGMKYAAQNGIEEHKAVIACLLHDCAKYMTERSGEYGVFDDYPPSVVHALMGREVAKRDYNIEDEDVLNAIAYHCTAKENMSLLEKLVYTADFTEEGRGSLSDVARKAYKLFGLDAAFKAALLITHAYLKSREGFKICDLSQKAVNFYAAEDELFALSLKKKAKSAQFYLDGLKKRRKSFSIVSVV